MRKSIEQQTLEAISEIRDLLKAALVAPAERAKPVPWDESKALKKTKGGR